LAWCKVYKINSALTYFVGCVAFPLGCVYAGILTARVGILGKLPISEEAKAELYERAAGMVTLITDYAPYLLMLVGVAMLFNTATHFRRNLQERGIVRKVDMTAGELHIEIQNLVDALDRTTLTLKTVAGQLIEKAKEDNVSKK